ncbi:MAG: PP2C family protein-serine/threonine phosphatase [Methanobrevibacter sp.]|nr:PP2C family protein-serine/threonine phosphatase [Candidatus Methanovirga aequatorialis]
MDDKLKNNLKRFLISLMVYAIVFTFFDYFEYFNDKIDPSIIFISFFPLIWGPWGIAGLFIGDLIGRIPCVFVKKTLTVPETVVFSLTVLLISIFIYKLYYSFDFNKKISTLHLYEADNLIKIILIICITNALYVFLHIYFVMIYSEISFQRSIMDEFINSYVFITNVSLIFSLLFVSIAGLRNFNIYKPKTTKFRVSKYFKPFYNRLKPYLKPYFGFIKYSKFINLMIIVYTIALFITGTTFLLKGTSDPAISTSILFNLGFIIFLVVFKPITKNVVIKKNRSFNELVMFILIFISVFSILASIILSSMQNDSFFENNTFFNLDKVINVLNLYLNYKTTFLQIVVTFGISIGVMYYLQKHFSKPLITISEIAEDYVLNRLDGIETLKESNEKLNRSLETVLGELDVLSNNKYDVGFLARSFKEMIENLEFYMDNLKKVEREKERIDTEISIASKIQKNMIPNVFPPFPDRLNEFDIYAINIPARNIGGDFYDYFLVDDDHVAIVIGDVSGKGVPAALFMSMAKILINDQTLFSLRPSEVFNNVNEKLIANNNSNDEFRFLTAWLGILELSSGRLTYVNAGHDPPFIFHNSRDYSILTGESCLLLGYMNNVSYVQNETTMYAGDRLFLYTDGITEGINKNSEQFQKDRLLNVLNKNKHTNIKKLIFKIKKDLDDFTSGVEQFDDETMIILEYRKKLNY